MGWETMDRIVKTGIGIFIVILVAFTGIIAFAGYTETAYRNTLAGTYSYTCTIATDSPLYNVTLFIPVPVDSTGNSPIVSGYSSHAVKGVPADWETTLFDTGKSTLLKVVTPAIIPPEGTSAHHPFTVTLSSETTGHTPVNTTDPVGQSAVFRPVQALNAKSCPQDSTDSAARCFTYTTSLYADYRTAEDAAVTITSAVSGKNTWTIFEPDSNEYRTDISAGIRGESHGWVVVNGELSGGIGTYDIFEGA
jgi:hypothetical protein